MIRKCSLCVLWVRLYSSRLSHRTETFFQFGFPLLLHVSLYCYCESSVHSKTVCDPWAQIGKSSASILGAFMHHWLIFHRRARSDQQNKDVGGKKKKKGCLLNVWLCKTKSFRFTGCFHNQTDCNMESCVSGNTGVMVFYFCCFEMIMHCKICT